MKNYETKSRKLTKKDAEDKRRRTWRRMTDLIDNVEEDNGDEKTKTQSEKKKD